MDLTIVIPCYNEERTVRKVIEAVRAAQVPLSKQIVAVDDASRDRTHSILQEYAQPGTIEVLRHERNRGKGAAIRTGIRAASGGIILIQDADLEYDPRHYSALVEPILSGRAEVVYGSRFLPQVERRVPAFWHTCVNRGLTFVSNALCGLQLTDMETCYKVFRREVIQALPLREERFGIEPEITARLAAIPGLHVYEVAVAYEPRTRAQGKKIGVLDGLEALWCIGKYNLMARLSRTKPLSNEALEGLRARWEAERIMDRAGETTPALGVLESTP